MIHPIELAWLAGFIDGEGSFGLYSANNRRTLTGMFTINNTHFSSMQMVMDLLNDMGVKFDSGMRKRACEGRKDQVWVRIRNRENIVKLMVMIEPYLVTKKLQVLLLLKYYEIHVDNTPATEEAYKIADKIKELNAYGSGIST